MNSLQAQTRAARADKVDMAAIRSGLAALEQMTGEMLYELRLVSDDEALAGLPDLPLSEALSRLVDETAEMLDISSRVAFSGEERLLSPDIERLLYRVAQGALFEVRQHTGTRRLRFTLTYGRADVQMNIEDDGMPVPLDDPASVVPSSTTAVPPFITSTPSLADDDPLASPILHALRHRIEHLGGTLEININIEQGTQVLVRIPYVAQLNTANGESSAAIQAQQASSPAQQPRTRVLVVDGQTVTRAGLRHLLESYPDLEVVGEASDGVQAASETAELGPQVVLMDTQLPNGQSLEALRQIKQFNPDTHVLLLSSLDREEYLYETLRAGAGGYVLKDIAPDELAQAVRTVARGELLVQPRIAGRLLSRFGKQARGGYPQETLTAREQEVLRLLAKGLRNKEIAARLYVSERTVNFHLANIYAKLNVSGRTEALSKALEQGLITA